MPSVSRAQPTKPKMRTSGRTANGTSKTNQSIMAAVLHQSVDNGSGDLLFEPEDQQAGQRQRDEGGASGLLDVEPAVAILLLARALQDEATTSVGSNGAEEERARKRRVLPEARGRDQQDQRPARLQKL